MNYLSQVSTGQTQTGQRMVISGVEKMGKTTLACDAPNALLVPLEAGYGAMKIARVPQLTTWEQIEALCLELIAGAKSGKVARGSSIVWDSATALERIIDDYTVRSDPASRTNKSLNMATAHGAYGKAYDVSTQTFGKFLGYMDQLALFGGINIILTCHVFPVLVKDPTAGDFHSWDLLLHSPKNDKTYGKREYLTQWADFIGFLHEPMFVMKAESTNGVIRGMSSGEGRKLAVSRTPAWVAGNRYGLDGVIGIPDPKDKPPGSSWNYLAHSIYQSCGIDLYNRSAT